MEPFYICFLISIVITVGKRVPEDGDVQKLMLYAGADQVLQKVSFFIFFFLFLFPHYRN